MRVKILSTIPRVADSAGTKLLGAEIRGVKTCTISPTSQFDTSAESWQPENHIKCHERHLHGRNDTAQVLVSNIHSIEISTKMIRNLV